MEIHHAPGRVGYLLLLRMPAASAQGHGQKRIGPRSIPKRKGLLRRETEHPEVADAIRDPLCLEGVLRLPLLLVLLPAAW